MSGGTTQFRDRADAGRQLAEALQGLHLSNPVVLALPRGGVPVAREVAAALGAPFDVFIARKVGAPGQRELGVAGVAEGDTVVANPEMLAALDVSDATLADLVAAERAEVDRRVRRYRGSRPLLDVRGRDVIVIDDGLATGVTAEAALRSIRRLGPRRLVFAAPVCAPESAAFVRGLADAVVCVSEPAGFGSVGRWYRDFAPTSSAEVLSILRDAGPTADRTGDRTG